MEGKQTPIALVLVNLGTPEAPTAKSVRGFLRQFLSDHRVVEIPRLLWWIILNCFVLPFRPKRVAQAYQAIWTDQGSPLRYYTERQRELLSSFLTNQFGVDAVTVTHAMTYGEPNLGSRLHHLYAAGHRKIVVFPLYPQYSGSTTAAVTDQVAGFLRANRALPAMHIVPPYFYREEYIEALAVGVEEHWNNKGRGGHLLMSFHGVPESYIEKGDPYKGHCRCTSAALAKRLGLNEDEYTLCFQSRFGKAKWVEPYTDAVIAELGAQRLQTLDVVCPAFASDCLETLEEIAMRNAELFQKQGGGCLRLVPCLNDSDEHIKMLAELSLEAIGAYGAQPV